MQDGVVIVGDAIVRRSSAATQVAGPAVVGPVARAAICWPTCSRRRRSASLVGIEPEAMRRAVEGFKGLEHALEPVAEIDGVSFVNDSKATNIEAARRAIRELRCRR